MSSACHNNHSKVTTMKTSIRLLSVALLLLFLPGCGRKPYLLSVKDGQGIGKDSHVFWDMGGTGSFKVVGDVTAVKESGDIKKPVLIEFDLREEFRTKIRENVAGAVLRDPEVAQGAFVLLMGGVGEDKEPLLRGVIIQEANTSASQAFFDWLKKDLPIKAKKLKEDAAKAYDQAAEWVGRTVDELPDHAKQFKDDATKLMGQASEWASQKVNEIKAKAEKPIDNEETIDGE